MRLEVTQIGYNLRILRVQSAFYFLQNIGCVNLSLSRTGSLLEHHPYLTFHISDLRS